eukprot:Colp12_sorted_trinity150504_noHs@19459
MELLPSLRQVVLLYWVAGLVTVAILALNKYAVNGRSAFLTGLSEWGKVTKDNTRSRFQVPKRLFWQFYVLGCIVTSAMLVNCILAVIQQQKGVPLTALTYLNEGTVPTLSVAETLLYLSLMLAQVARRAYECLYVSVYSDAKMHIFHYLLGVSFYVMTALSAVVDSPFLCITDVMHYHNYWRPHPVLSSVAACIFAYSSYKQNKAAKILAGLRERRGSEKSYSIPKGDLFDYVSSPHFLAEMFIYLSLVIVTRGGSLCVWLLFAFVVANQTVAALSTHEWYQSRFGDKYPKTRKALVPFLF